MIISHCDEKTWFFKDIRRIIDEKSVNVEDILQKEIERKAKFKPYGTKMDWTNKGVQEIFAEFLFKTLLFTKKFMKIVAWEM